MQTVAIESNSRLSQSILWQLQAEYFEREGVNAWNGQVPLYITSNPFIAKGYAQILLRYIQDHLSNYDSSQPFYILELGTGSGQFSYYCLLHLQQLRETLRLEHVDIRYVMTDFTEANLSFWRQQPQLQQFITSGLLDFAIFNLENPNQIQLENSKTILDRETLTNPLALTANYIFDTVHHDLFHVENGALYETRVTTYANPKNVQDGKPIALKELTTQFSHHPISADNYYANATLNEILREYQQQLVSGTFLFPTGAFSCLEALEKLATQGLLVLATDKAYTHPQELEGRGDPSIAFHGSISLSVNFEAIGRYCEYKGGMASHQPQSEAIRSSAFLMNAKQAHYPETQAAIQAHFHQFGAGDFFRWHRHLRELPQFYLPMVHSQLLNCHWDPYLLNVYFDKLCEALPSADQRIQQGFVSGLAQAEKAIYEMPGMPDHFFNIGMLYHTLKAYELAIPLYQKSVSKFGNKFVSHYNLGLCYHMCQDKMKAIMHFKIAKSIEPQDGQTEEWLDYLQKS